MKSLPVNPCGVESLVTEADGQGVPLPRLVRGYRIISSTATHVKIQWKEKFAPDNYFHTQGKGRSIGWKRRIRTVPREDLKNLYSRNPPEH